MKTLENNKTLKRAIEVWGEDLQFDMVIEECSELIASICHYKRHRNNKIDVASEIADVEIMCDQLRLIIGDDIIESQKKHKMERLKNRLIGEYYE